MIEVSSVEWNHEHRCYMAILSNGDVAMLESKDLRSAEQEGQRIADLMDDERPYGEFTNFRGVNKWE